MELSARRWGAGPVSLLWLHGFAGDGSGLDHLGDALGEDLVATCPDLPGHGQSSLPARAGGWEETLESLEPLLLALPRPRLLAGYSQGGRIALALALRAPAEIDALYLESAAPGIADAAARARRASEDEQLAQLLEREGLEAFLARWEDHPLLAGLRALPAPLLSELAARRRRHDPRGLAAALRALGQGAQPFFAPAALHRLRVPAAVAAGARDTKYADLARSLSDALAASLHLPDCGHAPHLEAPAEVVSPLRALCLRLGRARSGALS